MNWLKKLFIKESVVTAKTATAAVVKADAKDIPESSTPPSSISQEKLPVQTLKRLIPLRNMSDEYVANLSHALLRYNKGATLFQLGQTTPKILYLLKGEIEVFPFSEASYVLNAKEPIAKLPLNGGRLSGATTKALSEIVVLAIDGDFMFRWKKNTEHLPEVTIESIDTEIPQELVDNRFFSSFSRAYWDKKLNLPTLPTIAMKVKEAVEKELGVAEVVRIISTDTAIVAKLIQLANSPIYSPISPATNCHLAVTRIGLEQTRKLVMSVSLKQLFHSKNKELMKRMEALWKNSLYVSSICHILAQESGGAVDPEDALLAGLVCDIGTIPIIHFVEENAADYPDLSQLDETVSYLNASVGTMVLNTLGFPDNLLKIPKYAEEWLYESGEEELPLIDIVILAKFHSYFGKPSSKPIPYINTIPAYTKLGDGKLTPDFSLALLSQAKQRIDAMMNFLT
ncbi:MAG: HDOD domain-containing protein [Gammaproteobacteria bacterium]|nr:HDOD domain-containing protein [Gammaproteobacteria bacterium]